MFDNRRVWSFTTFIIVLYEVFPIGAMLTSFHTKIVTEWNGLRRNHKIISEIGPVWFFWSKNAQIFQKMVLLCIYANTQHHPFFLHSKCENDLRSFVLNHFRVTWQLNICENKRCETLSNNVKLIRFTTNKSSFEVILNPLLTSKASYYTPLTCLTFFLYLVGARLGLFSGLKRKLENFSSKNGESMHHHHGKADPNFQRCVPNWMHKQGQPIIAAGAFKIRNFEHHRGVAGLRNTFLA